MKKIELAFVFLLMAFFINPVFGQVGIGTLTPDKSAALDVVSPDPANQLGVLIPRMDEASRDNIQNPANGLLIFNTDENCINYYLIDTEGAGSWNSLCGGVGKASFESIDCSNIKVEGVYTKGVGMNGANDLAIRVNVTKPGSYVIVGATTNGYGFSCSGTALNPGALTILVPAQGTPLEEGTDEIALTLNGVALNCNTPPTVTVGAPTASYFINCGGIAVNPQASFQMGQDAASNPNNTVSIPVTVTETSPIAGNITITTNTVNGLSFSGNDFAAFQGKKNITLTASGTLTSYMPAIFNLFINSADGATTTCTFTITPVMPILKGGIASWGSDMYHLTASGSDVTQNQTGNMMANPANFGPNGIVKYADNGLTVNDHGTTDDIAATLNGSAPPDIVFISYSIAFSSSDIAAVTDYINNGGVVVFCQPENNSDNVRQLLRNLYGSAIGLQAQTGNDNKIYPLSVIASDPVINGPFMNLSGLSVGEDGGGTQYVTPVPSGVTSYSPGYTGNGQPSGLPIANTSFFFRDNAKNFIYIADGGFWLPTSPQALISTGAGWPARTEGGVNAVPSFRQYNNSGINVYNAYLMCNIMAWALDAATYNGINTGK